MPLSYCTIVYDGSVFPADHHLRAAFRLKGQLFPTGERVEVTADVAGLALAAAPTGPKGEGTIKVLRGEPTAHVVQTATAKAALRRQQEHARRFPTDPAGVIASVDPLPEEVLSVLRGKSAAEAIEKGAVDACLANAALWARLSGLGDLAAALARRAESLAVKA